MHSSILPLDFHICLIYIAYVRYILHSISTEIASRANAPEKAQRTTTNGDNPKTQPRTSRKQNSLTTPGNKQPMKNLRMKTARIEAGLSQIELAEKVGATRQTIGLIEAGSYNPSLKLCRAICRTLGKTLDDLFWDEEE